MEPSEGFWLVVPIAVGAWVAATRSPAEARRTALVSAAVLGTASLALVAHQLWELGKMGASPAAADLPEVAVEGWYVLALLQLAGAVWWALRTAIRSGHARLGGASDALAPQVLPPLVAFALVAPALIGSTLVHRPKIPDARLPDRPYEDATFRTADGLELRGWFLPAPGGSTRTLLFEPGLGANRSQTLPMLIVADRLRANALLFDLRGHGDSAGHTTSYGCREWMDVEAALGWLRTERTAQAQQVVAMGLSLSTAPTVLAAARVDPPFDGVILDSAFTVPTELADNVLRGVPAPLRALLIGPGVPLASFETRCWLPGVRPVDAIGRVRAPVWLAHADGDRLIPIEQGRRMLAAAVEPKGWFEGHGAVHLGSNADPDGWLASLGAFFDRYLPAAPVAPR